MRVDDFDFDLPEENIALRPVTPRDASRMLVVNHQMDGGLEDASFKQLSEFLQPGDALVFRLAAVVGQQVEKACRPHVFILLLDRFAHKASGGGHRGDKASRIRIDKMIGDEIGCGDRAIQPFAFSGRPIETE